MLRGQLFALSVAGESQKAIEHLVVSHGGSISKIVHRRVDLLVVTPEAVARNTQHVRKARDKYSIPLVTTAFLSDSVSAGELRDPLEYRPASSSGGDGASPPPPQPPADLPGALGFPSVGTFAIEVFVELCDSPAVWWPVTVSSPPTGKLFDIVYESLPAVGYDEPSPSRGRFDPRAADGVPDGAAGRVWDVDEGTWRPWRRAGAADAAAPPAAPAPASTTIAAPFRWKRAIRLALRRAPRQCLSWSSLRAVVLAAHQAHLCGDDDAEHPDPPPAPPRDAETESTELRRRFAKVCRRMERANAVVLASAAGSSGRRVVRLALG